MKQIPLDYHVISEQESKEQSDAFYSKMNKRRSVRVFSDKAVDKGIIENIIKTAGTAPSGAHKQPWFFVAISNKQVKQKIREAAETEEKAFYNGRASEEWLKDLEPFETNWEKPFLETAPWIIVVFKRVYDITPQGTSKNYYAQESVGIACGMLISAIHNAGLVTLTHTPSPMNFLRNILERPAHEKPFLLLPVGYPAKNTTVPNLVRKAVDEISLFIE